MRTYDQIMHTHQLYCQITSLDVPWSMERYLKWEPFCRQFSDDDLCLVVKFIKDKKRMGKPSRELTFRNLISGPESIAFFQEDLAEAKARNRATKADTNRTSVLSATGRTVTEPDKLQSAAQIIAGNVALAQLLKVRDSL